ncbi:STREFT protein [Mycoplasma putrefaciens]|uniref:STREFT protein n=1 Tax=Mycoplasma putrefaciens TaxID=2123 RepID=UPI003DA60BA5
MWWNNIANGHINVFGNKGILSNLIKGFKDIIFTSSELLSTISNYIKHIFYKSENKNFDLDKAFSNLASLIRISNNLLETQYLNDKNKNEDNLVMFLGLGPKNLAKIYSIYDILNLPHAQIFQTPVIGDLIVKYAGKFLKPFETIYQELKKYKFISDTRQFRVQFPKYLKRTADFIENYAKKHSAIPKYDLIENLYTENKNFAVDFATKWSKFFVPDDKDDNNPLLPIVKAILRDPENSKNEKIKSLADVRQAIQDLGSKLVNNKAFFKNFKSLSEILIPISKLSTFLGLKELEDINLSTLLSQIGETILNHNKKYSDKLIDLDITALGYILKSLTIKITDKNNNVLVVNNKNILSTIFNSLDAADNKTKEATEIPKNSYFLWDSVELKLDNKSLSGEIKISKTDSSASPLSILLGIGNDKTKYLTGSILHSLSTLIGGLKANDALYKLSLENKNSLIYGIDAWEEILKDKQKQLAKKEYQQAGQYYQNNSWITKLISYNHNQIKYQLIRTHDSNNDHVKKIGKKFEVTLSKSTNNHAYWIISQVLALDYQQ